MNTSDDILVYGQTQEAHDKALTDVFKRLRERNLTLNKGKCEFNRDTIDFYGFTFGKGGISPDAKKVDAIHKMSIPTSAKDVRSLLGLTNYHGSFHSTLTSPNL